MEKENLEEELSPFEIMKAPCTADEIEWKQDSDPKKHKKNWSRYVPYVDARALMERLDKAFEHFWSVKTEYMGMNKKGTDMYMSTIKIEIGNVKIERNDWAEDTAIGPIKGGASNAFKRAGTQFGFGRELYNYPTVYVQFEGDWAPFGIDKLFRYVTELFIAGKISGSDQLVIVEHKEGKKKTVKLHFVEYGKPGREIHGGAAPTEPKVVEPVKEKKSPYTEDEVVKGLFKQTEGKVRKEMEKKILNAWHNDSGEIHTFDSGRYIFILAADRKTKLWFKLNDYQATKIFK